MSVTADLADGSSLDISNYLEWSSLDPSVADASGDTPFAHPVGPGETTIAATFGDQSVESNLRVVQVASLEIFPNNWIIPVAGGGVFYSVTANLADGSSLDISNYLEWSSLDPSVADASGDTPFARSVGPGETTIRATFGAHNVESSLKVIQVASLEIAPVTATIEIGGGQFYTAIAFLTAGGTEDVSTYVDWHSSDPSVAVAGLATEGVGFGDTTITATFGDHTSNEATLHVDLPLAPISLGGP